MLWTKSFHETRYMATHADELQRCQFFDLLSPRSVNTQYLIPRRNVVVTCPGSPNEPEIAQMILQHGIKIRSLSALRSQRSCGLLVILTWLPHVTICICCTYQSKWYHMRIVLQFVRTHQTLRSYGEFNIAFRGLLTCIFRHFEFVPLYL